MSLCKDSVVDEVGSLEYESGIERFKWNLEWRRERFEWEKDLLVQLDNRLLEVQ